MSITHHELCFGCGLANLFGLQLEVEAEPDGAVAGRFFVKQDHQGPPGFAHGGVLTSAVDEAMALVLHDQGIHARTRRLEVDLYGGVPVGGFGTVRAWLERREEDRLQLRAELRTEGAERPVVEASGVFVTL